MWHFMTFWHGEHHAIVWLHAIVCALVAVGCAAITAKTKRILPALAGIAFYAAHFMLGIVCTIVQPVHATAEGHAPFFGATVAGIVLFGALIGFVAHREERQGNCANTGER